MLKIHRIEKQNNSYKIFSDENVDFIVTNKRKSTILISLDERRRIEETLYLSSILGYVEEISNIRQKERWEESEEYTLEEEW